MAKLPQKELSDESRSVSTNSARSFVAAAAAVSSMGAEPSEHVFRSGAVTSNITLPLGEAIVGNWGQPLARDVHDALHVRRLVLDDEMTQLTLVIADNTGLPREVHDAAKRLIRNRRHSRKPRHVCLQPHPLGDKRSWRVEDTAVRVLRKLSEVRRSANGRAGSPCREPSRAGTYRLRPRAGIRPGL